MTKIRFLNINFIVGVFLMSLSATCSAVDTSKITYIYKICFMNDWDAAHSDYKGKNDWDERDGFIHFSCAHQVERIVKKYYKNLSNLLLLKIPVSKVETHLKWESNTPGGDIYPHLYGTFSGSDVVEVIPLSGRTFDYTSLES